MQDDHAVGSRQSPGERAAATLESMPRVRPVEPVLAQQFAGILSGAKRSASGFQKEEAQVEGAKWDMLKKQGFLMAGQMLNAGAVSRQNDGRQNDPGKQDPFSSDEAAASDSAGGRRLPILRLGSMLLADDNPAEFVNELTELIGQGRSFDGAWHLEILLSSEQLSQTRLSIDCDETRLHLRFVCADVGACQLLEKNITLLQGRLSALSMRPVLVESVAVADAGAESGVKGPA